MKSVKFRIVLIMMIIVLLNVSGVSAMYSPQTQIDGCEFFDPTNHWVCNEFLDFFNERGGLERFGNPIREAFEDPARGFRVQYFEKARMELHPYNPEPYKVQLGLLVDELGYQFPDVTSEQIPTFNTDLRYYFPETNHTVSHAFLDYFYERGGLDMFGYPRSEVLYENGYMVQYFQRARMEWHPEDSSGPRMYLTDLGQTYVDRFDIPESVGTNVFGQPPAVATELVVTASVRYIITGQSGLQTVFVYITDQLQRPVSGAAVTLTVRYPADSDRQECPPTDDKGFTGTSFDILQSAPGQNVVIDVVATHGDLTNTTQTFFLPWW